jgi:hypothetical protein
MKPTYLILAASCLLSSCKEEAASVTTRSNHKPSETLQTVLAAKPRGDPQPIHIARTTARPGAEITLSGRIFGSANPFVKQRAVFTLGDPTLLTACNEMPGDTCKTPWDACCDSKEDKKVALATVQIIGDDGRILKEDLEGLSGLGKLKYLTVSGKVAENSTADSLIINASAIQVMP